MGQDDLTTILVAKRAGVSVGTLYHYFPNKYAIMYALAEQWVGEMDVRYAGSRGRGHRGSEHQEVCRAQYRSDAVVYTNQQGLLPLVQAMYGVPELKELDDISRRSHY